MIYSSLLLKWQEGESNFVMRDLIHKKPIKNKRNIYKYII